MIRFANSIKPFHTLRNVRIVALTTIVVGASFTCTTEAEELTVDFNRDIHPILSDACFQCHGPDQGQRVSDFRLDTKAGALDAEIKAIVAGDLDKSELFQRINSTDPDVMMPPPSAERRLTKQEIESLQQWIEQGAPWQDHWAFTPISAPDSPKVKDRTWRRNAIDDFVLARLEERSWHPAPEASRESLIRRVCLDLTGLPPTIEEVDRFSRDQSSDAYEKVVNRLLKSPRYGERMASRWLDAARYADTSGYQNDGPREMWRYRDWVIDAFNRNMPFDQFTIEQIAGDILAESDSVERPVDYQSAWRGELVSDPRRLQHLIPSAFHRNHRGNAEGGIIAEEYQVEYVVDRVDTTATVWLGLTLGCCRCHDHKYDSLSQRDFYQFFAFFNNVPEFGRAIKEGNSPPFITAPTEFQLSEWRRLTKARDATAAEAKKAKSGAAFESALRTWQQEALVKAFELDEIAVVNEGLVARFRFDRSLANDLTRETPARWVHQSANALTSKQDPPGQARWAVGKHQQALLLDGKRHVDAGDFANFSYFDTFTLSAWVYPTADHGTVVSRMTPGPEQDGYYLHIENGKVQLNLVKRWLDDSIRVESEQQLPLNRWTHIAATYDGTREASGIRIFFNGLSTPFQVKQDFINQTFAAKDQPVRIGDGASAFQGRLDDVRIYSRDVSPDEMQVIADRRSLTELTQTPIDESIPPKLREYYLQKHAAQPLVSVVAEARAAEDALQAFRKQLPTLMVMQEMAQPRQTFVLTRGEYDKPGESVSPDVPAALPQLPSDAPTNRLGLAQWLVSPSNPLTARVLVNRIWQMHFGVGLVKTTEDFGVQGERPSHPKLLDYLASELIRSGWDLKALHKLIVTSAVYRQSSAASREQTESDPENRLLSRGPRYRLPAEVVRDQALAISGLLKHELGGPSVLPYQPDGLWQEIATDTDYRQSHGDDLYRRSLYTYWKRTVAPPTMMALDAVSREACTVKRSRTNTPLQALALMNEVSFVEAARALAQRVIADGDTAEQRINLLFRLATARSPSRDESRILQRALDKHWGTYQKSPEQAQELSQVGEYPVAPNIDLVELAAYTMLSSMVLNLDEVISKE